MIPPRRESLNGAATVVLIALVASATALSVKCCVDLVRSADHFPGWFVPSFVVGIAALLSYTAAIMLRVWQGRDHVAWASGSAAVVIWILLPLSFVCTSAVHGFYPFRPIPLAMLPALDPILKLNFGLTLFGFVASASCGVLYAFGKRQAAVAGLLVSAVLLLVPNDACSNPFNYWWLDTVGASPLMFIPNVFAIVFGTAALVGVHRGLNVLALAGTGMSVGLLGLGHIFRVIW
jgi:hypothetical protein